MFTRGVERQEGFRSFTFLSNVSPYFPAKEWEEARRTLPEDVFRQESMAEFLEDSAGVFRGVGGCLMQETGEESHAEARRRFLDRMNMIEGLRTDGGGRRAVTLA